ncbi:MAG: hypothetical protein EBU90_18400 [Proteobacteria bacterium]|nr:hypothetical protein [Pseudomonadota bacterium]NBP13043.1 hypothetical protein [bacterium]
MDAKSYFVIEKKIKDIWEDWIVFNESIELDEVMKIYDTKKDKEQYRVIKRTDKVLHLPSQA